MRSKYVLEATFPITTDTDEMLRIEIAKAVEDFKPCPFVAALKFYDSDNIHTSTTLINTCYGEDNNE